MNSKIPTYLLILFSIFFLKVEAQTNLQHAQLLTEQYKQDLLKAEKVFKPGFIPIRSVDENGRVTLFDGFSANGHPEFKQDATNLDVAATIGANKVWQGGGLGLNLSGNGMNKLGIWDGGAVRLTHYEFTGRVSRMDTPTSATAHANGVAGIMMASGYTASAKGLSHQTNLKAWDFTNDRSEMIIGAPNLFVSNHAYANLAGWYYQSPYQYWLGDTALSMTKDWKFGFYDQRTRTWDSTAYAFPYYLIVKAAGNDRGGAVAPGTPHYYWDGVQWVYSTATRDTVGPYDCIVTYGTGKNILTVGAVGLYANGYTGAPVNTFSYSSWGPTDDGRIKPDVVTGTGTTSTPSHTNDSSYSSLGGTSGASAAASGSLLLLQQHHLNLKNRYMRSATLRGLAIHTADNCKTTLGPNYESGWGLLNIARAAQMLNDSNKNVVREHTLANNDTFNLVIYVNGIDTARVTICWTDPPATVGNPACNDTTRKLVNDLDLRLIRLSNSQIYQPYILNPNNPSAAATTGDNNRDNVEQVYATGLPAGFYKIRVTHKNNLLNNLPQAFSVIGNGFLSTPNIPSTYLAGGCMSPCNIIPIIWQKGNGRKQLVVIKHNSPVNALPQNGVVYAANDTFTRGGNLGNGNYAVYNDTGIACMVILQGNWSAGLYHAAIFEYNGDSTYTLYQTVNFATSSTIAPVTWLDVKARLKDNNTASITWSTASEQNNSHFLVERNEDSGNRQEWEVVGKIKGAGNSASINKYQFDDALASSQQPGARSILYRLKQVDFDGRFSYSKIVSVTPAKLEPDLSISVYPNPFNSDFNLKVSSNNRSKTTLEIYSIVGFKLAEVDLAVNAGENYYVMSHLTTKEPGLYFLKITQSGVSKQMKVVKN